ncbi:protein Mpe1p [[Candida] railenensis]|uniref:Protein Mpe1p n=1 Tax=[Candida] railenensis TaxID=45579 RepID=A0A9P0QP26_9ASCO|nr:protein Mpe1p [[Candida] railenensis]
MSSTIFYKFLHQKVQSTIHFDGTGISVFDLKFEIIQQNHLGDGSDFNLLLYHSDQPDVEYDNDQDVIPRSSFVLARRSPSLSKHGKFNNASRYVSGKPRIQRKQLQMQSQNGSQQTGQQSDKPVDENVSEEDRIKQMFENQTNAWAQTQDELSTHKVVYNKPTTTTQAGGTVAPEDMPPPGYMCYRCGGKDHWIRNCPTNTDPNYEGKKIKRTTGIPRSHLKTISKEAAENSSSNPDSKITTNENGDLVDAQGNIYMITDSGEYVIAVADSKTWMNYQQKQTNAVNHAKHEYELKLLECVEKDGKSEFLDPLSSTKKLLRAPVVMTPCCQTKESLKKMSNFSYNQQDLEQLLIDNDFRCPNCDKDEVYLDTLIKNEELMKEMEEYMKEKEKELGIENPETASGEKRGLEGAEGGDAKRQNTALPLRPDGMPHTLPNGMPMPPFIPGMPPMPMFMPPIPPPFMPPNK